MNNPILPNDEWKYAHNLKPGEVAFPGFHSDCRVDNYGRTIWVRGQPLEPTQETGIKFTHPSVEPKPRECDSPKKETVFKWQYDHALESLAKEKRRNDRLQADLEKACLEVDTHRLLPSERRHMPNDDGHNYECYRLILAGAKAISLLERILSESRNTVRPFHARQAIDILKLANDEP